MGGPATVLLVDDEAELRELMAEMLSSAGHIVVEAEDSESALLVASRGDLRIDLVVVDAGLGGAAIATPIVAKHAGAKVLVVSGDHPRDDRAGIPGTPFLGKPFGVSELLRKVREVLDAEDTS